MRQQLLACHVKKLDAVLFTHAHADHCHGIDELRSVNWLMQKPVDIFADAMTLNELTNRFDYIFRGAAAGNFYKPSVTPHEISGPFAAGDIAVLPFSQNHGAIRSLGFRFNDFAYSTDVHDFDESALTALRGIKTWIVDCVRQKQHPTHLNIDQTLEWIEKVKPERAYLTHLSHHLDYETLARALPAGVRPAHDGLVIEC
jgi:phosphoribosyl 1,2-cyclic phosphate phosphodiesterase